MPDYDRVAVRAVELLHSGIETKPRSAWHEAATEILEASSLIDKNCPRATFLSLCKAGMVQGIPPGDYVNAKENYEHSVGAAELLFKHPAYADHAPNVLWRKIDGTPKHYDYQMHVLLGLWKRGLMVRPKN